MSERSAEGLSISVIKPDGNGVATAIPDCCFSPEIRWHETAELKTLEMVCLCCKKTLATVRWTT